MTEEARRLTACNVIVISANDLGEKFTKTICSSFPIIASEAKQSHLFL
jgi:hypothetical protein